MPARATGVDGHVLPGRVARAAVDEQEVLALERARAGPRATSRVSSAIVACVHSIARRASTLNASMSSPPTAAASWLPRTPRAPISRRRADDRVRLGPVAHDVAQLPDLVDRRDRRQHRVEGREVGMDVREDGDAHRGSVAQGGGRDARERASQRALAALAGVPRDSAGRSARPARRRSADGLEARNGGVDDLEPAGPQGLERRSRRGELLVERQRASRRRGRRPGRRAAAPSSTSSASAATARDGHRRPRLAVARRRGRAPRRGPPPRRPSARGPVASITVAQEADLLGDGVDEQRPVGGQRGGERETREAAAAAEVEEPT